MIHWPDLQFPPINLWSLPSVHPSKPTVIARKDDAP
jgi:hypothetical protein